MLGSEIRRPLSLALLALFGACASPAALVESAPAPAAAVAAPAQSAAPAHVHWSYEGEAGPAHWGALAPEFALCSEGRSQSPVNLQGAVGADLANLELHYQPTPVEIVNNGHAIQVNYAPGSSMVLDGVRFDLLQFHFHSPSEHTLDGEHAAAEMHLVHKSADGSLAVIGVLLEEGVQNSRFDPVWKHLPAEAGPVQRIEQTIQVADLLPSDPRTYRYVGSLTTPPGTEGVRWNMMVEPVTLSRAQIEALRNVIEGNNRPVQPLNGRTLQMDTSR